MVYDPQPSPAKPPNPHRAHTTVTDYFGRNGA
jgi:hypothetical protein